MTPRALGAATVLAAWMGFVGAGVAGEITVAPREETEPLTAELLERVRRGRAIHEEFASGAGCTACHAREARPVPSALRGAPDPTFEQGPSR
jgi:hypothetical protein